MQWLSNVMYVIDWQRVSENIGHRHRQQVTGRGEEQGTRTGDKLQQRGPAARDGLLGVSNLLYPNLFKALRSNTGSYAPAYGSEEARFLFEYSPGFRSAAPSATLFLPLRGLVQGLQPATKACDISRGHLHPITRNRGPCCHLITRNTGATVPHGHNSDVYCPRCRRWPSLKRSILNARLSLHRLL
jgi:hypothetical protein